MLLGLQCPYICPQTAFVIRTVGSVLWPAAATDAGIFSDSLHHGMVGSLSVQTGLTTCL